MNPWKVLVVDDEEGIHGITRMIFRGYEFEQRPIELISAMSGAQARELLTEHPDIALALLDVVMENDDEGLQLVEYIRNQLNNRDIRVILRTGHPGYAPESQVIVNYDINDYLSKAELSASRLLTSVVVALRSFRDIKNARLQAATPSLAATPDNQLLKGVTQQLNQQIRPILKLSQKLQQMDLNPVAKDLATDLHAQHQRLQNSIGMLDLADQTAKTSPLRLTPLMDEMLSTFLSQSRREGWLLDYRVDDALPAQINTDPERIRQILISAIELAILQANGEDLKLSAEPSVQPGQLRLSVALTDGQPVFSSSPWAQQLQNHLQRLCQQLQGELAEMDESGAIHCQIPLL
ncbi:Response regulator receiver domain-containing protein [Amphritea atlantica]|uniref:Response regulator receiver domain-containing protein n=1 Tax=Amphritea atlantica TaxID=355243 RepID=A0A1H9J549_9GAMM|nr:response regulator [Amphritea atlantica]SEQ81859.1 Response regulator receiver domain-containing protein [Amphritea atlantica]